MPTKIVKLGKRDDIVSVIKQIKNLREREVIFELEKGSIMLASSDNLKLMKRTGEALGKTIKVQTTDEIGQILAKKAGVLFGDAEVRMPKQTQVRVARSDVKPRFSDILSHKKILSRVVTQTLSPVAAISSAAISSVSKRTSNFTKLFILGLVVLVLVVLGLAIFLPKATITVFARSEPVTRDLEITVDKNTTTVDSDNLQIPGVAVSKEISQTKNFSVTGVKLTGTKASGTVTLYNFSKHTLKLNAKTTTLIANGKKYLFTKDVAGIRATGGTPENPDLATLTPGVSVVAEQPGESYNLQPNTKFQIVNPALGNFQVYAMNPVGLGGGAATSSPMLSQDDLDKAVESLSADIVKQAESDLSTETGVATKLLDSGITKQILAKTANKNVGDAVDNFNMTVIAKIAGLSFKDSDVTSVALSKINQVLSKDKYLLDDAKKQYTAQFKSIDLANSHGVLAVHFGTTAAFKVDETNLPKILAGKNESEIKEILLSKPEIDNVTVKFWPSWFVHKAPRLNGKVYIKTELSSQAQ